MLHIWRQAIVEVDVGNRSKPEQYACHFANDIFESIFLNANLWFGFRWSSFVGVQL